MALLTAPTNGRTYSVYSSLPQAGAPFPYILFVRSGGEMVTIGESVTVLASYLFLVKVVTSTEDESVGLTIADMVQTTLETMSGTMDGDFITCIMEDDYLFTETQTGKVYKHTGGYFRIRVRPVLPLA